MLPHIIIIIAGNAVTPSVPICVALYGLGDEADVVEVDNDEIAGFGVLGFQEDDLPLAARPPFEIKCAGGPGPPVLNFFVRFESKGVARQRVLQPLANQPADEGRAPRSRIRVEPGSLLILDELRAAVVTALFPGADFLERKIDDDSFRLHAAGAESTARLVEDEDSNRIRQ